jgi:hypothetical protein
MQTKVNREASKLNYTIEQIDPKDITKHFIQQLQNYTFFSSIQGNFSRINHKVGQKF